MTIALSIMSQAGEGVLLTEGLKVTAKRNGLPEILLSININTPFYHSNVSSDESPGANIGKLTDQRQAQ